MTILKAYATVFKTNKNHQGGVIYAFCIDPSGEELTITDYTGTVGEYVAFDDLFLNHTINNKPLIELVQELEYGE